MDSKILSAVLVFTASCSLFGAGLTVVRPSKPAPSGFSSGGLTRSLPTYKTPTLPGSSSANREGVIVYRVIPEPVLVGRNNLPEATIARIKDSFDPAKTTAPFIQRVMKGGHNWETTVPEAGGDYGLVTSNSHGSSASGRPSGVTPMTRLISFVSIEGKPATDPELVSFQDLLFSAYSGGLTAPGQRSADKIARVISEGKRYLIGDLKELPKELEGLSRQEIDQLVSEMEALLLDTLQMRSGTSEGIGSEALSAEMVHLENTLFPEGRATSEQSLVAAKARRLIQEQLVAGGTKSALSFIANKLAPHDGTEPTQAGKEKAKKFCLNCLNRGVFPSCSI